MTEKSATNQLENDLETEQIENNLKIEQLEKLRLEIDGLKNKNVWDNSLGKWIPVITALIAVAGFLWGIYVYNAQQAKAEKERIEAADQREKDRQQADIQRAKEAEKAALDREQREKEAQEALNQNKLQEERKIALAQQTETNRLAAEQKNLTAKIGSEQQTEAKRQAFQQKQSLDTLRQEIAMANANRLFEAQKPYREKQMQLYFDAAEAAATIASSSNEQERLKAEHRFWQLYWGPLSVIEDAAPIIERENEVVIAMVIFAQCSSLPVSFFDYELTPTITSKTIPSTTFTRCERLVLNQKSLCLGHIIREAVHRTWNPGSMPAMPLRENVMKECKEYPKTIESN